MQRIRSHVSALGLMIVRAVIDGELHRYTAEGERVFEEVRELARDGATYIAVHPADYSAGSWRWWPRIGSET